MQGNGGPQEPCVAIEGPKSIVCRAMAGPESIVCKVNISGSFAMNLVVFILPRVTGFYSSKSFMWELNPQNYP